jgi:hypothetical protein
MFKFIFIINKNAEICVDVLDTIVLTFVAFTEIVLADEVAS